jgi:hypothetical protein
MPEEPRRVTIDTLTQDEVAQLAYAADVEPAEVRAFEEAVKEKMLRCGFSRIERTELYLKVQRAVRDFQKEMAVRAAVDAFKRSQAPGA